MTTMTSDTSDYEEMEKAYKAASMGFSQPPKEGLVRLRFVGFPADGRRAPNQGHCFTHDCSEWSVTTETMFGHRKWKPALTELYYYDMVSSALKPCCYRFTNKFDTDGNPIYRYDPDWSPPPHD